MSTLQCKRQHAWFLDLLLITIYRDVLPGRVWREDFDWKNETYDEFCNRIGWKKYLLKCIFASRGEIIRQSRFQSVLNYDVKL